MPRTKQVRYHPDGEGTAQNPFTVGFTFVDPAQAPSIEELRESLPKTVTVEERDMVGSFLLTGADPRTRMDQLLHVWHDLTRRKFWVATKVG